MSPEVAEMEDIKREKENIQQLIKIYQQRNAELNAKEEVLIQRMEAERAKKFDWRRLMKQGQDPEGYVVCDSALGIFNLMETPEMRKDKILKLREEVLQKQYENMKLEKELENRKEEHRIFHEMLMKKKEVLGGCLQSQCPTSLHEKIYSEEKSGNEGRASKIQDNKHGSKAWEDMRSSLN